MKGPAFWLALALLGVGEGGRVGRPTVRSNPGVGEGGSELAGGQTASQA